MTQQDFNEAADVEAPDFHDLCGMSHSQQVEILSRSDVIGYYRYQLYEDVLSVVRQLPAADQVKIYSLKGAMSALCDEVTSKSTEHIIDDLAYHPRDIRAQILAAPRNVLILCDKGKGQAPRVMDMIAGLDPNQQVEVLKADSAIEGLASAGQGMRVIKLLEKQNLADRQAVLVGEPYFYVARLGYGDASMTRRIEALKTQQDIPSALNL